MNTFDNTNKAAARLIPVDKLNSIGSLISEGANFNGSFNSKQDLGIKVDGALHGDIIFENGGTIHIGPTGVLENTSMEADYIFIEGRVTGNVIARKSLEITGSATLIGDAIYDSMIDVHPRAKIRGKLDFRGDVDATA